MVVRRAARVSCAALVALLQLIEEGQNRPLNQVYEVVIAVDGRCVCVCAYGMCVYIYIYIWHVYMYM